MARRVGGSLVHQGAGYRGLGGSSAGYNPLTQLGTLGALWDFSLGVTTVSGGVDSILDQTGRGNTLTAPAAGNRPAYSAADADFNSQPTGTGDGTDDGVRKAAISLGSAFAPGTVILVCKAVTSTSGDAYFSMGVNSTIIRENGAGGQLEVIQGTGSDLTVTTFQARAHALAVVFNGSTSQIYIDGAAEGAAVAYTGTTADGVSIGLFSRSDNTAIAPANVKIAFAAVSMTALSVAQIAAFGTYSRTRFGTP
jgi:hypothetical protein